MCKEKQIQIYLTLLSSKTQIHKEERLIIIEDKKHRRFRYSTRWERMKGCWGKARNQLKEKDPDDYCVRLKKLHC